MAVKWNAIRVATGLDVIHQCRPGLLTELKELLDAYRGESRLLAYYDLLAGDWLEHFLHVAYAAYLDVSESGEVMGNPIFSIAPDSYAFIMAAVESTDFHRNLRRAISSLMQRDSTES